MHTGFLTHVDDFLQIVVVLQGKRDGDLVQLVFRQNVLQIADRAQNLDAPVHSARRHMIIQNAVGDISPLGIVLNPVQISLRRARIADQQDVL